MEVDQGSPADEGLEQANRIFDLYSTTGTIRKFLLKERKGEREGDEGNWAESGRSGKPRA